MLSHNDCGVWALIIGGPLYIKHSALKYPIQTLSKSDQIWRKNKVTGLEKNMYMISTATSVLKCRNENPGELSGKDLQLNGGPNVL